MHRSSKSNFRARLCLAWTGVALGLMGGCGGTAQHLAPGAGTRDALPQPGLIVLVVVDQLRYDLLDRYADLWVGGFRDLLAGGTSFVNATHDHAVTETAPGHATIATGTHPAKHGIVGNGWLEADGSAWNTVENVVDRDAPVVGHPELAGASPAKLQRSGLADWLLSVSPRSTVVSIAGKDRAAVLLAAQAPGYVYWYSTTAGRFVTSTHYRSEDSDWVTTFNRGRLQTLLSDSVWSLQVPEAAVGRASADSVPWESNGVHVSFPHMRNPRRIAPETWIATTPVLDVATLDLSRGAMEELELGLRGRLDFLAVGLSQTDRIGHAFGPGSLEQLDNLLRLDRALGRFIEDVETHLQGRDLTLVLTSDHGVLDAPELRRQAGLPGRRLGARERDEFAAMVRAAGEEGPRRLAERLRDELPKLDWVDVAWPDKEFQEDSLGALERNSFFPGRFPGTLERYGVGYRLTEGTLDWGWPRGTTHGTPYFYDRHVPLLFYGTGIGPSARTERAATTSIAPTVARWLSIPFPSDTDGPPLLGTRPAPPSEP